MNDKNKSAEFSYYGLYLLKYLRENHPDRASDTDFIEERADHAADVYEQSRLEGATPEGAQELAMAALLQDLHFSKYNTVIEVLWNEFADEVPPGDAPAFARRHCFPQWKRCSPDTRLRTASPILPDMTDFIRN